MPCLSNGRDPTVKRFILVAKDHSAVSRMDCGNWDDTTLSRMVPSIPDYGVWYSVRTRDFDSG